MELEINRVCNRSCINCNRLCNMKDVGIRFDVGYDMTVGQVKKFVLEMRNHGRHLDRVTIIGGEPLLHPNIDQIVSVIERGLLNTGLVDHCQLITNKTLPVSKGIKRSKVEVKTLAEPKDKREHHFCFFVAPIDKGWKYKRCECIQTCGFLLCSRGYFPCVLAPSISYVFNIKNLARFSLPQSTDDFGNFDEIVCKYCPWGSGFDKLLWEKNEGRPTTRSWLNAMLRKKDINDFRKY